MPGLFPDETQHMSRGIPRLPAWETFPVSHKEEEKEKEKKKHGTSPRFIVNRVSEASRAALGEALLEKL